MGVSVAIEKGSVMTQNEEPPSGWAVGMARLEGKLDRLIDANERTNADVVTVRASVHAHANEIQVLLSYNIKETQEGLKTKLLELEKDIDAMKADRTRREGAMALLKTIWALIGILGLGGVIAIAKIISGMHV